jgi:hypothetical protein
MSNGLGAVDIETIRREIILQHAMRETEFSNSLLKWSITSLQILNGGAIVVLVGDEQTRRIMLDGAGWLFAGGLLCAFLTGIFMSVFYNSSSGHLFEKVWKNDSLSDDSFLQLYLSANIRTSLVLTFLFGLGSFTLFVAGCGMIAAGNG